MAILWDEKRDGIEKGNFSSNGDENPALGMENGTFQSGYQKKHTI